MKVLCGQVDDRCRKGPGLTRELRTVLYIKDSGRAPHVLSKLRAEKGRRPVCVQKGLEGRPSQVRGKLVGSSLC